MARKPVQLDTSQLYKPFARQAEFHVSPAKYRMFGGSAGPGKSRALLEEGVQLAAENPGVNVLLLRRTYGELESSIIEPMRKFILPFYAAQGAKFNESTRILRLPNNSNVYFGYCRNENDVYQYQGGEFFFIGIDELTHFTLKQWQFLTSRNRCPVKTTRPPGMAGATNPGNIGHAWVKALWIDHTTPPGWDIGVQPYDPKDYDFIRATLADNPIYANDQSYIASLQSLPANMRRAFLNGDWDIFAGQYFTNFEKSRHVVPRNFQQFEPWIQRWMSIDWGFGHNSAVHWHARLEDKRVFTYRETMASNLSPRQLGEHILKENDGDDLAAIYLSPDAYAKRESYITIADQISDVFRLGGFPMCQRADNDRVSGWSLMYDLLDTDQWVISEQCENLIETLPLAVRDPDYLEDVLKFDSDDSIDGARYGLKSHIKTSGVPLAERVQRKVFTPEERQLMQHGGTLPDMTQRIRYMLELQKKENVKMLPAPIKRFKGRPNRHL